MRVATLLGYYIFTFCPAGVTQQYFEPYSQYMIKLKNIVRRDIHQCFFYMMKIQFQVTKIRALVLKTTAHLSITDTPDGLLRHWSYLKVWSGPTHIRFSFIVHSNCLRNSFSFTSFLQSWSFLCSAVTSQSVRQFWVSLFFYHCLAENHFASILPSTTL